MSIIGYFHAGITSLQTRDELGRLIREIPKKQEVIPLARRQLVSSVSEFDPSKITPSHIDLLLKKIDPKIALPILQAWAIKKDDRARPAVPFSQSQVKEIISSLSHLRDPTEDLLRTLASRNLLFSEEMLDQLPEMGFSNIVELAITKNKLREPQTEVIKGEDGDSITYTLTRYSLAPEGKGKNRGTSNRSWGCKVVLQEKPGTRERIFYGSRDTIVAKMEKGFFKASPIQKKAIDRIDKIINPPTRTLNRA